jgi:RNA polymerase sigma-70 factor (ECF subfamily)
LKDEDLILGLINQRVGAINYFVNNYQQFVFILCIKMLNDREVSEEISQDVLIKCIDRIDQFKGDSKLKTWVYSIARREVLNYIRINKIQTSEITPVVENHHQSNELVEQLEKDDLKLIIDNHFNRLPIDQKELMTLFYLHELSLKEIAVATELSESNVRVKLYRARENFKTILSEKDITLLNQFRYG